MIYFHPTYLLLALSYILTGYYINLIVLTSLIVIHELGHYTLAKILKFNVEKIIIYPYGGITKIKDLINKDINKELIISISGIIFQLLFFYLIVYLNKANIIRDYTLSIYLRYNKELLLFNILPIYPLDGSKILNLLLSKYLYFNLSNKLTIIISILTILILIINKIYICNYGYILTLSILITYLIKYIKNIKYIYNKFLLERYIYNINYKKIAIINSKDKMYKNKTHLIKENNKYIKEKNYLKKYFSK
ncbi:MAG: hypothetical protein IJI49_05175 [Bacilli bacterium]|nr:hypothetical protein [Bacilli bacterium]